MESSVSRTFTLGKFFDTWGVRLSPSCMGAYCNDAENRLQVFVDGEEVTGNIRDVALNDLLVIAVTYGTEDELPTRSRRSSTSARSRRRWRRSASGDRPDAPDGLGSSEEAPPGRVRRLDRETRSRRPRAPIGAGRCSFAASSSSLPRRSRTCFFIRARARVISAEAMRAAEAAGCDELAREVDADPRGRTSRPARRSTTRIHPPLPVRTIRRRSRPTPTCTTSRSPRRRRPQPGARVRPDLLRAGRGSAACRPTRSRRSRPWRGTRTA